MTLQPEPTSETATERPATAPVVAEPPAPVPEQGFGESKPGDRLTPRQRRIVAHIRYTTRTRGYPPTLREIGDAVGLTSPSSVVHQLDRLHRLGVIRRVPGSPRAIELVDDHQCRCGGHCPCHAEAVR